MEFDERRLRAVVAIAENGSLGRAAEAIHVSQPALSRMLGDLEARLETKLFERYAKGMVATQAGEILIEHARQLTFDIEQARHALQELRGLRSGQVRIGAVAATTRALLPRALEKMRRQAPGLKVELMEAPDSELTDALLDRRIDLIVASDSISHADIEPLSYCDYEDSFQVCCRAIDPPVAPDCGLSEALAQDWVMLKRGRTPRSNLEALIKAAGHSAPNIAVETNTIGTQISILRNSDLLGWLPLAVIADQCAAGQLQVVEIPELLMPRRFRVYRRKQGYFPKHTRLLYSCLTG
ncbi:LysR family transcriptional regulator [Aurantiacibacter xanthus]|uniref:LysR family transcriptional regulator n=1 Tax=Aurantiacibacter xanthus TaxID=1784712 RepID=A0A3A1P2E9_9SPHN|nr:LysR family transcriptional regulator [Aurantiacibacter xanthus]RIV82240.1 LysR family transcriptional regulator [Aurantiacibacter xanthus]